MRRFSKQERHEIYVRMREHLYQTPTMFLCIALDDVLYKMDIFVSRNKLRTMFPEFDMMFEPGKFNGAMEWDDNNGYIDEQYKFRKLFMVDIMIEMTKSKTNN